MTGKKRYGSVYGKSILGSFPLESPNDRVDMHRMDAVGGSMWDDNQMDGYGIRSFLNSYIDMEGSGLNMNNGFDDSAWDYRVVMDYMFPAVYRLGKAAVQMGYNPMGLHVKTRLRSSSDGSSMQLIVTMVCFYGAMEKMLYLVSDYDQSNQPLKKEEYHRMMHIMN